MVLFVSKADYSDEKKCGRRIQLCGQVGFAGTNVNRNTYICSNTLLEWQGNNNKKIKKSRNLKIPSPSGHCLPRVV